MTHRKSQSLPACGRPLRACSHATTLPSQLDLTLQTLARTEVAVAFRQKLEQLGSVQPDEVACVPEKVAG